MTKRKVIFKKIPWLTSGLFQVEAASNFELLKAIQHFPITLMISITFNKIQRRKIKSIICSSNNLGLISHPVDILTKLAADFS